MKNQKRLLATVKAQAGFFMSGYFESLAVVFVIVFAALFIFFALPALKQSQLDREEVPVAEIAQLPSDVRSQLASVRHARPLTRFDVGVAKTIVEQRNALVGAPND
uniref:Uncharacterized protein n=1 Tax=viral metagenome TaxID=1070528 RepID=A0A6H1ZIS6_9ZZZZ